MRSAAPAALPPTISLTASAGASHEGGPPPPLHLRPSGWKPAMKQILHLNVNGQSQDVLAPIHHTLLEVLREEMDLTGTKHGCELGECGACTVLVDGVPTLSCLTLPIEVQGSAITTVEGLAHGSEMHPLQVAFAENGAAQCGYCTPGILMSATALLDKTAEPTEADLRQ